MVIEFDEECSACKGTGVFQGMAERDGFAVVCHKCGGTGKSHFIHEYQEFTGRKEREGITNILQTNPGIMVGKGVGLEFGGISYEQWKIDGKFPKGSEMRNFTCPAWWYQSADYKKKPKWDRCIICGSFSNCKYFEDKSKCWELWDKEYKEE